MRITSAGNVGIGTTSPAKQLQVRGDAPWIRIEEDSASSKRLDLWVDPSSAIAYVGANQSAQQLSFQTASSDRIRILNNGNVGIGTTSPANKLDVVGTIYSTNIRFGSNASGEGIIRHYSGSGQGIGITTGTLDSSGIGLYVSHLLTIETSGLGRNNPSAPLSLGNGGAESLELNHNISYLQEFFLKQEVIPIDNYNLTRWSMFLKQAAQKKCVSPQQAT